MPCRRALFRLSLSLSLNLFLFLCFISHTFTVMDLEHLCSEVQQIALEAARFIREERKKFPSNSVESKGLHNYVTYVDTSSEKIIVEGLKKLLPDCGFIVEEGTVNLRSEHYNWIIDPLDGTTNFIHGLPPYSISIALMDKNEIILGLVYELNLDECFYAWKNGKSYLNGKEIKVSETEKVSQSLIATGFPYTNFERIESFMYSIKYFMENSHGLRRLGSAAVDMAYVASGRFDGFYEYGLNAWDVAAAVLIIQQAGGRVCDFSGGDNWLFGKEIITSNDKIYNEFLAVINNIMV